MKCSQDAAMLLKLVERERIFEFFVGLIVEFVQVQVQVLGKETLLSLLGFLNNLSRRKSKGCCYGFHKNNDRGILKDKEAQLKQEWIDKVIQLGWSMVHLL